MSMEPSTTSTEPSTSRTGYSLLLNLLIRVYLFSFRSISEDNCGLPLYRYVPWYPSSMSRPYLQRNRDNVCGTYYKAPENNNAIDDDNNRYINTLNSFLYAIVLYSDRSTHWASVYSCAY